MQRFLCSLLWQRNKLSTYSAGCLHHYKHTLKIHCKSSRTIFTHDSSNTQVIINSIWKPMHWFITVRWVLGPERCVRKNLKRLFTINPTMKPPSECTIDQIAILYSLLAASFFICSFISQRQQVKMLPVNPSLSIVWRQPNSNWQRNKTACSWELKANFAVLVIIDQSGRIYAYRLSRKVYLSGAGRELAASRRAWARVARLAFSMPKNNKFCLL